ncbi:MAG: hypothetical protein HWQ35_17835 [Nostoc sp. NMS1]|uniref:hypothetical protein n=1 Tax=Nostoc sp. NMS1 TaxID=2815388 RepID=UPI001685E651|nr:hypothetical protein [Nostoc sp. NMS1]MBD2512491.1 hypothetical protein [Desmonostoc muscorum FACHB-395]MBN3908328.1 hypothetical protein [Nostoc sp. NMS1]
MTQPPQSPQTTPQKPVQRQTKAGQYTEQILKNIWEPVNLLGQSLMGDYWKTVYLSIQDAIALAVLLKIPELLGQLILGKSFSDFGVCLQENALGASRYACFIIVASDFMLWIVIAGRIIGRFWADLNDLRKQKGTGGHGANKP